MFVFHYPINMTRNQWLKTAYTKDGAGWYFNSVGQPCSADDADGTQDPELRKRFRGHYKYVVNYFTFLAQEVREYLATCI